MFVNYGAEAIPQLFRELRWFMTYDVLDIELSWQVKDKAYFAAYSPVANLAGRRSQRAIEKEVKDVC